MGQDALDLFPIYILMNNKKVNTTECISLKYLAFNNFQKLFILSILQIHIEKFLWFQVAQTNIMPYAV